MLSYKAIYNFMTNLGLWGASRDYLRMTDLTMKCNDRTNWKIVHTEVEINAQLGVWTHRTCVAVTQWCLTLCDPMDCSLPGSSVHRILQARVSSIPLSRGFSQPRDWTWVWATMEALRKPGRSTLIPLSVFTWYQHPDTMVNLGSLS